MTPERFTFEPHPARVRFGVGALELVAEESDRLGLTRVLLITSERLRPRVEQLLGARVAATETAVVMHVPLTRALEARAHAQDSGIDGIVAVGGGSAVGLAKAVALELPVPILAVPSTFAGSELTSVWGLTQDGLKRTGRDERVRPRVVLYDPALLRSLPPRLVGASGLNALAHAAEALYAQGSNPVVALLAEQSARLFGASLERAAAHDEAALAAALQAAWLAGTCLDRAAMGLHHKLCHTLGGTFGLPHAELHALMLPHSLSFNLPAAPQARAALQRALGVPDVPLALQALVRRLELPASLRELGLDEGALERAATLATQTPYDNPRPFSRMEVLQLLRGAFAGQLPEEA